MSESTQRWRRLDSVALPVATPEPQLPLTIVSERLCVRPPTVAPVVFPGYEVLSELGRGGMGVVYKARQRNLNRLVALKVILGGPLASSEDKARFRIEAEAAARLHHPNIVQVYDVGEYAGFSYMALELVEGSTLRKWQDGKPVDPWTAARLAATIARAVHHAHEQGIVHRDIKPANILLAPITAVQPEFGAPADAALPTAVGLQSIWSSCANSTLDFAPKVTDFGLAKALSGGADLTVTGVACGTPNYMAPEQVRGKPAGPGMDVYGLGGVLFELLTGRPPFIGSDPNEVMTQIIRTEPIGVRKLVPRVPRDLAVIVAKCLEKDTQRRYATARDLADDLDRFLSGSPIAARPIGTAERAWRWGRRNPVVAAFLVFSTLGCLVTGGLALALARAAEDERSARAAAESAREEADQQRRVAEAARDGLGTALAAAQTARQIAEREKKVADAAESASLRAARVADDARLRAEANLRVTRGVIRGSMRELSRHPRFEEEDFRDARGKLIDQLRQFRDTVAAHAPNTPEWLDDLSDVSFFLGYLHYVNQNHNAAAVEYQSAAAAAGRWAQLEPRNPEPRARQSFSLLNSGNALRNANRNRDAEIAYGEACKLIDAVVRDAPDDVNYRHQAVTSYGKLAELFRSEGKGEAWYRATLQEVERAEAQLRINAAKPDNLRGIALAHRTLANRLMRVRKFDEADCHLSAAVAIREQLRDAAPREAMPAIEYAATLLAYAEFLVAYGFPDGAGVAFERAVATVEKVHAAAPESNDWATELAGAVTRHANFLHDTRRWAEAERAYDRAMDLATAVTRRSPSNRASRDAWMNAAVGRAHLLNGTGRHREAAGEWARLAVEDPNPRARRQHELFVVQSLLYAGDHKAATAAAEEQMKTVATNWMVLDLARAWCLIAQSVNADATLVPADKLVQSENAVKKAVACLEQARAAGEFNNPERVRWVLTDPDFAPVRGKFDPKKK